MDGKKKYPVICGWCGRKIGTSPVENSTGICKSCKKNQEKKIKKK